MPARYSLVRLRDEEGASGSFCEILDPVSYKPVKNFNSRPLKGYGVRVGTYYSSTNSTRAWWQSAPITEILEDTPNYMCFRTKNSIYVWRRFDQHG